MGLFYIDYLLIEFETCYIVIYIIIKILNDLLYIGIEHFGHIAQPNTHTHTHAHAHPPPIAPHTVEL